MLSWTVLLSEIERRFTESHCNVLIGIHALNPTSDKSADFTALKPFANAYSANETDLSHELHQAKRLVERLDSVEKPKSMLASISCLERYKEAFPELYRINGVTAIALPVSTSACERSFSCLRHIKTWRFSVAPTPSALPLRCPYVKNPSAAHATNWQSRNYIRS